MSEANFISPLASSLQPPASLPSRRRWPWPVLGVLLLACLLVSPLVYASITGVQHVRLAKQAVEQAYAHMSNQSLAKAEESLLMARRELSAARVSVQAAGPWRSVPGVSAHLQAVDQALQAGDQGLQAATQLLSAVTRVHEAFITVTRAPSLEHGLAFERSFRDLSRTEKRAVLARLDQALPDIRSAREQALIALDTWERIPTERLVPPLQRALEPLTRTLRAFRVRSEVAVDMLSLLLPVIGYPEPKTYIVLLQNADELRPTGGFIGTVGVVRVEAAELTQQVFQDVYAYDRLASSTRLGPAPEPLRRELGVNAWFLRDSNWSPDAPQTAERIQRLFANEGWLRESDGVIFLEPALFASLLTVIGPLTVDGVTFTPEGFFDQLQYAVEVGFAEKNLAYEARKDIVSHVGAAMFSRLSALPVRVWGDMFDRLLESLSRKDIMLVMSDPALQKVFDAKAWSGRARAALQDELWVVDTNLAALKTDGVMRKHIDYSLDLTPPAGPLATVRLTYTNTNRVINWRYTRYRDYVRVFVPEGSELISSTGVMAKDLNQTGGQFIPGTVDVMQDLGKTVFGGFWSIEPGATRTLTFTYRLPERVRTAYEQGRYTLLVQKQPGAKQRLTVDLRLGKKVVAATPPEAVTEFGDDRYRWATDLDKDKLFEVLLRSE